MQLVIRLFTLQISDGTPRILDHFGRRNRWEHGDEGHGHGSALGAGINESKFSERLWCTKHAFLNRKI